LAKTIKTWAEDSQDNILIWAESTVMALARVGDVIYGIKTAWEGMVLAGTKGAGWLAKEIEGPKEKAYSPIGVPIVDVIQMARQIYSKTQKAEQSKKNRPAKWSETIDKVIAQQEKKFSEALFDTQLPSEKIADMFKKAKFKASDFGAGAGAGGADAGAEGAGVKAARDVRQRLQFREARQLTFAPGTRFGPEEQTAKNTLATVKGVNRMVTMFEKIASADWSGITSQMAGRREQPILVSDLN